jgi:hypothetical protein
MDTSRPSNGGLMGDGLMGDAALFVLSSSPPVIGRNVTSATGEGKCTADQCSRLTHQELLRGWQEREEQDMTDYPAFRIPYSVFQRSVFHLTAKQSSCGPQPPFSNNPGQPSH